MYILRDSQQFLPSLRVSFPTLPHAWLISEATLTERDFKISRLPDFGLGDPNEGTRLGLHHHIQLIHRRFCTAAKIGQKVHFCPHKLQMRGLKWEYCCLEQRKTSYAWSQDSLSDHRLKFCPNLLRDV